MNRSSQYSLLTIVVLALMVLFSCSTVPVNHHSSSARTPPRQVKKVTGSKSARPYAPAQQKKSH